MKKQELLDEISKLPDDIEFILANDDEGNGYRYLNGVSLEYIRKDESVDYVIESTLSEEEAAEYVADISDEENPEDYLQKVAVVW